MLYTPFTFQFFPSSLAHNIANFSSPCPGSVAPPRPAIPALLDSPTHHTECTSAENSLLLFVFQPLPFKKQFTQQLLTKASPKSPPTVGKTMFSFPSFSIFESINIYLTISMAVFWKNKVPAWWVGRGCRIRADVGRRGAAAGAGAGLLGGGAAPERQSGSRLHLLTSVSSDEVRYVNPFAADK
ncbi:Axonemal Dynein Light Chain Domain-Containing Protein 1 [Manis pentadactyla]|nr:Axonemal Dynein Light Chain Domain-Containing Protein 1 [Manis pentadactyla]